MDIPDEVEEILPEEIPPNVEDEEADWTVQLPPETAEEQAAILPLLAYRDVTEEDTDRLWDWIRADRDGGLKFLGLAPLNSTQLRARLELFGDHLLAIDGDGGHLGFLGCSPVTEAYVGVHLYLSEPMRGTLRRIAPVLIAELQGRYPDRKLTIIAADVAEVRLYASFGFTVAHILTLAPPTV